MPVQELWMGLLSRLLDRPVADWTDPGRLGDFAAAASKWQATWRPPPEPTGLSDVLPQPVKVAVKAVASRVYLPDRDMLERVMDHDLVDRLVVDFITRLLASFAHQEQDESAAGGLFGAPISRLTDGLENALTERIAEYAETHRELVARYIADVLTRAEELPEFARFRSHIVDVAWPTPLARLFPEHDAIESPPWEADRAREGWEDVLARIGGKSPLELLVAMGFDAQATRELVATIDAILDPSA